MSRQPPGWRMPAELKRQVETARSVQGTLAEMYGGVERELEIERPLKHPKPKYGFTRELLSYPKQLRKGETNRRPGYDQWHVHRDNKTGRFIFDPGRLKMGDEYTK